MARPCLDRNPKFKRLIRELRQPKPHVRGYLEMLWDSANECGDPVIGDSSAVEAVAEWPGEAGELTKALLESGGDMSGFIELEPGRPGVYRIHDYWDHAPDYVKKRRQRELERRSKGAELTSGRLSPTDPARSGSRRGRSSGVDEPTVDGHRRDREDPSAGTAGKSITTNPQQNNDLTTNHPSNSITPTLETSLDSADNGRQRQSVADNGQPPAPAPAPAPAHNDTTSPLPPPTRGLPPDSVLVADPEWVVVVEFLNELKVSRAWKACETACSRGCTPTHVRNTAEFYRGKLPAWGPGALYARILELQPGQNCTDHWPPPSKEIARDIDQQKTAERQKTADKKRRDDLAEIAREELEVAELEKLHGSELDSLPRAELRRMIQEHFPKQSVMYEKLLPPRGSPPPGTIRSLLLRILSKSVAITP